MAHPKRRHSNQRTRKRRTHHKVDVASYSLCTHCGSARATHTICPACGYYRGKPILTIRQKEKKASA